MDREPDFGVRVGGGIGRAAVEGRVRVVLTEPQLGPPRRAHPGGCQGRAHRRRRHGLRRAQPDLDLPVHRHGPAGGLLPERACPARRGCRPRASPTGRPGPQHRCAGRREPRMEAGPGGRADLTREPAGHVPRRAASGRRPRVAEHDGHGRAQWPRRPAPGPPGHHGRAAGHGRAAHAHRGDALRARHPVRPRGRPPAGRSAHARPRPGRSRWSDRACSPSYTMPVPCSSPSVPPTASTALRGRIGSGWSRPGTTARGSSRWSARSRRPRPC